VKGGQQKRYPIYTTNRLLGQYSGAFGVKTGYTTLARNTLIAAATRNGRTYIVTLMGSERRTAPQAAALLDWAFANGRWVKPVGWLAKPMETAAVTPAADRDLAVAPSTSTERAVRRAGRRKGSAGV
jgi:D-alanyl-D-alanine carboxypeptidase (penicillin-binding protein 5/6)